MEYVGKLRELIELAMMGTFDIGSSVNVMRRFFKDMQLAAQCNPEITTQIIRYAGEDWDE